MIDPNNPNGVIPIGSAPVLSVGSVIPPIPSPTTATPSSVGLSSYVPQQSADQQAIDAAQKAELARLAAQATPESESERRARITSGFQSEIDALNAVYAQQKQEAIQRGMGRLGSDAAVQARRGLIGSTFGAGQTSNIESANTADVQAVEAEKARAMAGVFARIQSAVSQDAKDKQTAQATSAAANLEYLKSVPERKAKIADETIKALIAGMASPTEKDINDIAAQIGIDPAIFKKDYITAAQAKVAELQKQQQSDAQAKAALMKINADISKPQDVGDYTYMYNKATGEWENKGLNTKPVADSASTIKTLPPEKQIIVNTLLNSNKFTKDQKQYLLDAASSGMDLKYIVKNQAKQSMSGTTATKVEQQEQSLVALARLKNLMADYYANGGKTNIVKGNLEQAAAKFGAVQDEKLRSIATDIEATLQVYRNAISGTAFSNQESASIASIFPGIDKTEGLNDAILNSRVNGVSDLIDAAYANVLGPDVWNMVNNSQSQVPTSGVMKSPDGTQEVNVSDLTPAEIAEAKAAGWQ